VACAARTLNARAVLSPLGRQIFVAALDPEMMVSSPPAANCPLPFLGYFAGADGCCLLGTTHHLGQLHYVVYGRAYDTNKPLSRLVAPSVLQEPAVKVAGQKLWKSFAALKQHSSKICAFLTAAKAGGGVRTLRTGDFTQGNLLTGNSTLGGKNIATRSSKDLPGEPLLAYMADDRRLGLNNVIFSESAVSALNGALHVMHTVSPDKYAKMSEPRSPWVKQGKHHQGFRFYFEPRPFELQVYYGTGSATRSREIIITCPPKVFHSKQLLVTAIYDHPSLGGQPGLVKSSCAESPLECPKGFVASALVAEVEKSRPVEGEAPTLTVKAILANLKAAGNDFKVHTCADNCKARKRMASKREKGKGFVTTPYKRVKSLPFSPAAAHPAVEQHLV